MINITKNIISRIIVTFFALLIVAVIFLIVLQFAYQSYTGKPLMTTEQMVFTLLILPVSFVAIPVAQRSEK